MANRIGADTGSRSKGLLPPLRVADTPQGERKAIRRVVRTPELVRYVAARVVFNCESITAVAQDLGVDYEVVRAIAFGQRRPGVNPDWAKVKPEIKYEMLEPKPEKPEKPEKQKLPLKWNRPGHGNFPREMVRRAIALAEIRRLTGLQVLLELHACGKWTRVPNQQTVERWIQRWPRHTHDIVVTEADLVGPISKKGKP